MTSAPTARPKFVTVGDNPARAFSMEASERAVALAIKAGLEPATEREAGRSTIYADLNWAWDPEWLVALAGMPGSVLTKDGLPVLAHVPADGDPAPVLAAMLGQGRYEGSGLSAVDADTAEQVKERTIALLEQMVERNGVDHDDIISVLFTATDDIHSIFPATAARDIGFGDIPLICARELDIVGATPRCIRVLMHLTTERGRAELRHVYLEGAAALRDDLPE